MTFPGQRIMRDVFGHAMQAEIFDHFVDVNCKDRWNTLESDANSDVTLQVNGRGGVMNINADVSLNEEAYIYSNEVLKFNGDLPIVATGRMVADADTEGKSSWIFGIMNNFGDGDNIVDAGLTLKANFTGCVFFKPVDTNRISVVTSTGSATSHTTDVTNFTQVADPGSPVPYVTVQLEVVPKAEDYYEVVYRVDERGAQGFQQCARFSDGQMIKHVIRYNPSSGGMSVGAGLKNGKAAEASILRMDFIGAAHQAYRNAS